MIMAALHQVVADADAYQSLRAVIEGGKTKICHAQLVKEEGLHPGGSLAQDVSDSYL